MFWKCYGCNNSLKLKNLPTPLFMWQKTYLQNKKENEEIEYEKKRQWNERNKDRILFV